jgi:excisionase family DNA binding protein
MDDKSDKKEGQVASQWRTIGEACDILGVSRRTIQRHIKRGIIESKLENGRRFVLVSPKRQMGQDGTEVSQPALIGQLQKENEQLQEQLREKDKQIESLQKYVEEASERHDTIVLQLTRQLDQSQRLLEYHQAPWWRRWFRKSREEG